MEANQFDLNDYLHREGFSDIPDIAPGHGMQGAQASMDGRVAEKAETQSGSLVPSRQITLDNDKLEALVPDQVCACATCLASYLDIYNENRELRERLERHPDHKSWNFRCRVINCQWTTNEEAGSFYKGSILFIIFEHERLRDHYGKPGDWKCREASCKFTTKRWSDFKRHSSSKHCIKPQNLECPDLNCKYHQIGFSRKDKLKSHVQTVHGGMVLPAKPNQAIQPKVNDSA